MYQVTWISIANPGTDADADFIFTYKSSSFNQSYLLKGLGNLGLQNFHQRTLSAASSATAKITCFAAAFIVPTLGIPPILLGAVAASTSTVLERWRKKNPTPFNPILPSQLN